jgi:hypothetical protein
MTTSRPRMVYRFPSVQGRVQGWAVELATIIKRWIKRVKLGPGSAVCSPQRW